MIGNKKNIYKDFFLENDLILSSYFSFAWTTSGIGNFSKIPRIKQKLNKKCFVGIDKNSNGKIKFNKIFYYDNISKNYIEDNLNNILSKDNELKVLLKKITLNFDKNTGFEINILSEIPRGYSLGFSGTIGALIVSAIYSYFGRIDNNLLSKDILKNKKDFDEIRKKAFEFELISKNNNTAGESSLSSFINNSSRIFYNISNFNSKNNIKEISGLPYNSSLIGDKNNFIDKNLDYILVFSGLQNNTEKIEKHIENDKKNVKLVEDFILKNNFLAKNSYLKKIFLEHKSYENINDTLAILNTELFYNLLKLNETGEEKYVFKILDNLNKNRFALKLIEKQIDFDDKFIQIFEKNKKYNDGKYGITSLDSSKNGGMYLIVSLKKDFSCIVDSIKKLKKIYPDTEILFNSEKKLNNNKNYGVKIEQFISKKFLGEYSNNKGVLLKNNLGNKIIEYKNLEKLNYDILIDSIKNKIYIGGEKLTSKEIHSQSIATEILIKLINSDKGRIKNSDISFGSYRENKIELNGKVVLPLNRVILKKMKYNFPLKINGETGNYKIILEKHNLNIGIIEKI